MPITVPLLENAQFPVARASEHEPPARAVAAMLI
jgi:hypothetical protein